MIPGVLMIERKKVGLHGIDIHIPIVHDHPECLGCRTLKKIINENVLNFNVTWNGS